ncbi:MAG: methyltransferase domain-containing protein [Akkermansiaceae bacterium]|jgi:predicted nicotinamide N-methyase|tara:strand:- start:3213 stop:3791 length:579 start_codon:yes stop_codon:yes gene_type:complete
MPPLFKPYLIGSETFALMELKHPQVEQEIIAEMSQGIDVYYDRRWATTGVLTEWFAQNTDLFLGKRVLIIGAGIGAETLILGRHASHIWINDISPTALTLCQEQLKENGIENATSLVGRYEELDLPEVDLVVASFLVYNDDTYRSMSTYMDQHQGNLILVNERLAPFPKILKEREHRILFEKGAAVCAHFLK